MFWRQFRSLLCLCAVAGAVQGAQFVVTASTWGDAQNAAVTAAGGTVRFQHNKSGIALVTSNAPDFITRVLSSKSISTASADLTAQWCAAAKSINLDTVLTAQDNDTLVNLQWGLQAIEAPAAWAAGFTGKGARVAVVDGGIWEQHQDLKDNIDKTRSTSFYPGFHYNEDVGTSWHGTTVAGIIASAQNGAGIIGVAPQATIIAVKVLHGNSGSFGNVIAGILYAATPVSEGGAGADIINLSIGLGFDRDQQLTDAGPLIAQVNRAVNYAVSQGVLVVAAAGNEAMDLDHSPNWVVVPAMSSTTVGVAATGPVGYGVGYPYGATNFRRPASYTNFGNSVVNFAAPGGDFRLVPPSPDICSIPTLPAGSVTGGCEYFDLMITTDRGPDPSTYTYALTAGTSLAAPVVSGVAALIKQRFPKWTGADIKAKLGATSDDEGKQGHDPYYGRGFVNARRAVTE